MESANHRYIQLISLTVIRILFQCSIKPDHHRHLAVPVFFLRTEIYNYKKKIRGNNFFSVCDQVIVNGCYGSGDDGEEEWTRVKERGRVRGRVEAREGGLPAEGHHNYNWDKKLTTGY